MRVHLPSRSRANHARASIARPQRTSCHRWRNSAARLSTSSRRRSIPRSNNTSTGTKVGKTGLGNPSHLLPSQQTNDQSGGFYPRRKGHHIPRHHLRCLQKARRKMGILRCQMCPRRHRLHRSHRSEPAHRQSPRSLSGPCLAHGPKNCHHLNRQSNVRPHQRVDFEEVAAELCTLKPENSDCLDFVGWW